MIKRLLSFMLVLFSFIGFAQGSFSFFPTDSILVNPPANTYSQYYIYQANNSGATLYLGVEIIENDIPTTFDGMMCIEGACMGYFPPVGTIANMSPLSDTSDGYVRLTVNPFTYTDQATIRVRVFNVDKPNDSDTATWVLNSQPVGLEELVDDSKIEIYPNPANNRLNIVTEASLNANRVSIIDLNGRIVMNRNLVNSSINMDVSNLLPGVYFVETHGVSGVINRQKLVVNE